MEPVKRREWKVRGGEVASAVAAPLAEKLGLTPLVARLLGLRGLVDADAAERFLDGRLADLPDPFALRGMAAAAERVAAAVRSGEKILVHGDYDVDGITATTLLVQFLDEAGAEVGFHIPLRLEDGYGLSARAIEQAAAGGVALVVSVDCGVTAVEEARLAKALGIDLVVTDHHQPPATLPDATAIVNPHLPGCPFPDKDLAGVGVAFLLAVGVRRLLRESGHFDGTRPEPDLRHYLDLVALGTIADVVPLAGINRILARVGLQVLNGGQRVGARALQQVSRVEEIDAGAVGFRMAPRLNAAGRIEDAALGVKLLLTGDEREAQEIAGRLDEFNRERQNLEARILRQAEQAVAELDETWRTIVLADPDWHTGVVGIVASRLVEKYGRPTILFAIEDGLAKGSGRSTRDIDLYRALSDSADHLQGFGGHAAAAGVSLDPAAIDRFAGAFEAAVVAQQPVPAAPCIEYDGAALLSELTIRSVEDLALLAPCGMGNPAPVFSACGVAVSGLKVVGDRHLKFTVRRDGCSLSCIAFGLAGREDELTGEVDLLFVPEINRWNGRTEVQLRVRDWRTSQERR